MKIEKFKVKTESEEIYILEERITYKTYNTFDHQSRKLPIKRELTCSDSSILSVNVIENGNVYELIRLSKDTFQEEKIIAKRIKE